MVGRGATVENDTRIGARVRIQAEAYVTAYCELEDDVFIAPCVVTTNDNFMGRTERRRALMKGAVIRRGARVGGAAILLPGVEIGEDAFVGAGAIVLRDVPPRTVVVGQPARVLRDVAADELLDAQALSAVAGYCWPDRRVPAQAVGAPAAPHRRLDVEEPVLRRRVADAQQLSAEIDRVRRQRARRRAREVDAAGRVDRDVEPEVAAQRQPLGAHLQRVACADVDLVDVAAVVTEVGDRVGEPGRGREHLRLLRDVVRLVRVGRRHRRPASPRRASARRSRRAARSPSADRARCPACRRGGGPCARGSTRPGSRVSSGWRASSTAAAALTCGTANEVPSTVPSTPIVMPGGASSDEPVAASERGTVVMMPSPGAAMSLNTGSVFENVDQASFWLTDETPITWRSAAGQLA